MVNEYFAWEWLDSSGSPMYVGWGKKVRGVHPAEAMFKRKVKEKSELTIRLATFKSEPQRSAAIPEVGLTKAEARTYCSARRLELRKKSVELLSSRPLNSRRGGGSALRVVDDRGDEHESVRAAAEAHRLNACTVSRYVRDPLSGWFLLSKQE